MFAEDRFFERWTDELLAEFATHVKIARVAPNDLLDVLEDVGGRAFHGGERRDRVQQRLVLHRYEVENNIDMFATVHLKFAAEICAGGGGVGVRRHDAERRRRGRLRQPSVRQRHMTTLTCRYRSTAQVLASGNGAVRASSPAKE
ncbi:hypothetical protein ACWEWK_29380 [Streptomyces sp. NPDC003757]